MSIRYIEHTSDVGLQATGATKEELFQNCALGMVSLMLDTSDLSPDEERTIDLEGVDDEDLLYGFLSEIIYLFDGEGFIPLVFSETTISEGRFKTIVGGCKFDPDLHKIKMAIKAVTYHQMEIKKVGDIWQTNVIFDV